MRRAFLASLVALVAGAGQVLAGSRVWQPDVSKASLGKRYFVMSTDPAVSDKKIWENKQIRYCFDTPDAQTALEDQLKAAHELWKANGLSDDFTIASVGDTECRGDKRFDTVLIQLNTDNPPKMGSFVGVPADNAPLRGAKDPNTRPKMVLTTSTGMGMLDQVANFAHELGHVWGLYHEHQNPAFWSKGTVENALGGSVFGPEKNNWNCQNLLDYSKFANPSPGLVVQNPGSYPWQTTGATLRINQLCNKYGDALWAKFSAADYLPMPKADGVATSAGGSSGDVDWDSIMIYPSGAGATGSASPGNDQRSAILLKPDGSRIPINTAPSQRDIQAMNKLYGRNSKTKQLLQKVGGTVTTSFKKLYSKSSGQSSSCL